jgi:plastocyanin
MIHPLVGGTIMGLMKQPDPDSPIKMTSSGMSATFKFPNAGVYGFYCDSHGTAGMNGAVFVE